MDSLLSYLPSMGGAVFTVLAVLGFVFFWLLILLRRVVPTNMVHIVQSSKLTTPYGRGKDAGNTYYEWWSWLPIWGVTVIKFPESIFEVKLSDYDAYDQSRLPFKVDVVAFFQVQQAETAAQRVFNFEELKVQLHSVLQGSVRRILATNRLEHILEARAELGEAFTAEVKHQIEQWGVTTVKMIEFMDLRDSKDAHVIQNIMEKEKSRIDRESRTVVAENTRAAETAEIEAQQQVQVRQQEAEQMVGQRTAEKDKQVGIAREQAQQEVQSQAKTTAERKMAVVSVEKNRAAEIAREVAVTNADAQKQVKVVDATAAKEARVVEATGNKEAVALESEGRLTESRNDAQGVQAEGEANANAAKLMQLAPVEAQVVLAKEIGQNEPYQKYLLTIREIEANQVVGVAMADGVKAAKVSVISTDGGQILDGVKKAAGVFSASGGTNIGAMLQGLSQTEEGKNLIEALTKRLKTTT